MGESEDIFDEWEDALLDQLIQVEELALSAIAKPTDPSQSQPPHLPPPSSHAPQQPLHSHALFNCDAISYSPPRELSQRTNDFDSLPRSPSGPAKKCTSSTVAPSFQRPDADKDLEIERLKRELGRASKQLAHLEKECLKLKKERDKKEEQLKLASSSNEEENARTNCSQSINNINSRNKLISNEDHSGRDSGFLALDHHKISSKFQNGVSSKDPTESTFKAKGVQTDMISCQEAQASLSDDLPAYLDLSQKLLAVWGSPSHNKLGRNVISKLLVGCQRDFHILFGCMSINLPSNITMELLTDRSSSGVALQYLKHCFHTPEAAKVSHLYLALTKITDGTDVLETLIEPLLDLCSTENVVIAHSSLCILHTFLKLLLELEKNFGRRDNVFIEGLCFGKDVADSCRLEGAKDGKLFYVSRDEMFNAGGNQVQPRFSDVEILGRKECWNHQNALQPHVNWLYLFEIMHQIAMRITEESMRVEAVSIMNLVLLRSNAYIEREQFSWKIIFKTVSELLKKDAGLCVKKHALRLLYLVLNCPKLLATFCHGCKEGEGSSAMDDNTSASDFQTFKIILQGLADCVASHGSGLLELKLSRNSILVLAFLASSGKPGFEILVGHRLSRGVNYLMLILQLLVSVMDLEAGAYEELPEIFRERTFLIREILILLNRLVSSSSYSATVLRGLTSTRDMAGLTIDVASRLSRKVKKNEQQDSMVKHIRETEIVDLARLFKKRVFTYLGDDLL